LLPGAQRSWNLLSGLCIILRNTDTHTYKRERWNIFMSYTIIPWGVVVPRPLEELKICECPIPYIKWHRICIYPMYILLYTLNHLIILNRMCFVSICYIVFRNNDKNNQSAHVRYRYNHTLAWLHFPCVGWLNPWL
jgi:hypothetical protein